MNQAKLFIKLEKPVYSVRTLFDDSQNLTTPNVMTTHNKFGDDSQLQVDDKEIVCLQLDVQVQQCPK